MSGPAPLTDAERRDLLRLIRTDHIGPITFTQLLARFGSASVALDALPDLAARAGRKTFRPCPAERIDAELARLAKIGARLIARCEPEYPPALAALDEAPPVLAVRGKIELLTTPTIAVVGARNASANGLRFAQSLAAELGKAGFTVVSGLARGIDAAAHRGSLATGTVACMAGGVDSVYPSENQPLYEEIVAQGVAVSEQPAGLMPRDRNFPQRNRIVSGIALGVVVVEAALRSGSLITARLAGEQGREVFAVPGSPLDPRSHGTNDLIRNGATLVESAEDVLRSLGPQAILPRGTAEGPVSGPAETSQPTDSDIESALPQILEKLGPSPTPVDEVIRRCHLPASVVLMALLELELAGRISRQPGNMVSLI